MLFQVKNRIPIPEDLKFETTNNTIPSIDSFFPTKQDQQSLREEFKVLMARDLTKNLPELEWMKEYFPKYISHKYDNLVTQKSEVVIILSMINALLH